MKGIMNMYRRRVDLKKILEILIYWSLVIADPIKGMETSTVTRRSTSESISTTPACDLVCLNPSKYWNDKKHGMKLAEQLITKQRNYEKLFSKKNLIEKWRHNELKENIRLFKENFLRFANRTSSYTMALAVINTVDKLYSDNLYLSDVNRAHRLFKTATYSVLGTAMSIGILGNLLVIISVGKVMKVKSVTNIYLMSLAVADLSALTIAAPLQIYHSYRDWQFTISMNLLTRFPMPSICALMPYVQMALFSCNIITMTVISMERFIAIRYPLSARTISTPRKAKMSVVLIWMSSLLMALPEAWSSVAFEGVKFVICKENIPNDALSYLLSLYAILLLYAIPGLLMTFFYVTVAITLRKSVENTQQMRQSDSHGDKKEPDSKDIADRKRTIVMLITSVVLFFLFWGPYVTWILLERIGRDYIPIWNQTLRFGYMWSGPKRSILMTVALANSCFNPFIYAIFSRSFRGAYVTIFSCGKIDGEVMYGGKSSVASRDTGSSGISKSVNN